MQTRTHQQALAPCGSPRVMASVQWLDANQGSALLGIAQSLPVMAERPIDDQWHTGWHENGFIIPLQHGFGSSHALSGWRACCLSLRSRCDISTGWRTHLVGHIQWPQAHHVVWCSSKIQWTWYLTAVSQVLWLRQPQVVDQQSDGIPAGHEQGRQAKLRLNIPCILERLHSRSVAHSKWIGSDCWQEGQGHFWCFVPSPCLQSGVQQFGQQWQQTNHYIWECLVQFPLQYLQSLHHLPR